jgi:hypothetical protein
MGTDNKRLVTRKKDISKRFQVQINLEKILKSDIRNIYFKNIHISPDYLQQIKKNIFAMIRQLGPPTFFFHIYKCIASMESIGDYAIQFVQEREKRNQTETLENDGIDYLIRKDPVTCTHYYKHRINALKKLICHDEMFFERILDYYFVI